MSFIIFYVILEKMLIWCYLQSQEFSCSIATFIEHMWTKKMSNLESHFSNLVFLL
jgi:hypothetical protein